MYQTVNVTMDCVCAMFTLMVFVYLRVSPDRSERLNILFAWICIFNAGMLLGDLPNWLCEGLAKPWYPAALWLGCFIQYLSGCLITWVYSLYLHTYLSKKFTLKGWTLPLIHFLCAIDIVLIILNLWNGKYYLIIEGNFYQRGEWYWISQIIPVTVLLLDAGVILFHRRALHYKEIFAFLGYLMLPVIGVLIQMQIYGIAITYLASSIALFIIFLYIQSEQLLVAEQQKRDLDKAQVMVMISQIQPHFLYNSLLGIKQLCNTEPKRASEALEHFSYYLRWNLYSLSDSKLIPFEKELGHVQDYLYLEKMRFEERLTVQWEILFTDFLLPPLTLQPIVENAVRHGITKKDEGGILTVRSEEIPHKICITITDNGVGYDQALPPDESRPHIGIENVKKRIKAQCGGCLSIHSKVGEGTEVTITLPKGEYDENYCSR